MFGLGGIELGIIVFIIILLFGGKKLPELSRGIADSIKELKNSFREDEKGKKKD